ncbi:MAG: ribosome small subunit-dependent GTPase A [Candidatus Eisenbacteria bacterium]|nr:ribosome small subunit-dependent GTPase A [Candidatus Eisenbacteria bacterium]
MSEHVEGTVVACHRDDWEVALDSGLVIRSSLRGRHFIAFTEGDKPIAPGDRVRLEMLDDGTGVINDVLPRATVLSRRLPGAKRATEQVVVANADQLVVVASFGEPRLNRRLIDRFLVVAEEAGLSSVVALNKIDLSTDDERRAAARAYELADYPVVLTCAQDGSGVAELSGRMTGRFSVLAGPSGAGKSSLLNALEPGLGIRVAAVSRKTGKGRHTTSSVTVFRLSAGGMVVDTPGFRELGLWRVRSEDIGDLFPEIRRHAPRCRFKACSHGLEPDCAVKQAVAAGDIDHGRYESYLKLRSELAAPE